MTVTTEQIKALRDKTGISVMLVRKALVEAGGDEARALKELEKLGVHIAEKKEGRSATSGAVESYVHHDGSVGTLLILRSETDFVARNEEFRKAAHHIAMHIAAMNPSDMRVLLASQYIQDTSKTVNDVITELTSKFGEKIVIDKFIRYSLS